MTKRSDTPTEAAAAGSLTRSTLHGVLWMTGGRLIKAPTNIITIAILARLLTPTDFGVVAIGFVVTALAAMLVDGTFGMVLVQRRSIDPQVIGASLLLSMGLAAIFGLALIVAAPLLQGYFHFPQLTGVLQLLALVLPVSAALAVTTALLQRAHRFGLLTVNSFIAQLINAVIAISLAFAGAGVWSLVWSQLAQVCIETLLDYRAVRPQYKIGISRAAIRETLHTGGMFTVSKMFNWAAANIDNIVIGRFLGPASLGLYSRPRTLMHTINQAIGTGTARVLFSTFARMQHDLPRMRRAFERTLSTSIVGATAAGIFVIMFADVIVRVLLGPKWLASVPVMQALFGAFLTRSGYIVAEAVPLALGLGRASAYRQGAQFMLVIAGAWVGSHYGIVGAAAGVAVAYWLFYLLCLVLVHQLLHVGALPLIRIHLKGLAIAALPTAVTIGLRLALHPGHALLPNFALAAIFGLLLMLVVGFAPESLVSADIVRVRSHALRIVSSRLRTLARAH